MKTATELYPDYAEEEKKDDKAINSQKNKNKIIFCKEITPTIANKKIL